MLLQDDHDRLEVKSNGRWIDAPPISGTFVCNIGDMLDRMTPWVGIAPTRTRTAESNVYDRLSFRCFFDPNFSPGRHRSTKLAHVTLDDESRDAGGSGERARVRRDVRRLLAREDLQGVSAAEPAGAVGHSCPAFTSPGSAGRCIRIRSADRCWCRTPTGLCRGQSPGCHHASGRKNGLARLDDHFQHLHVLEEWITRQGPVWSMSMGLKTPK